MRSSAGLALEDGPHRKVQRIQVLAPWGLVFFADERRDVGLNPPLGHSWAMWRSRVLLEGPRCSLEVLSGPWQQFTFQNVRNVPLALQFHPWKHENEGRPSSGCDGRPNHNRSWILASTHSPALHGCIPTPNTVILMVHALLNVKFLLVREHQIGATCHLPWDSEGGYIFWPSFVRAWVWAHGASASCRGRSWGPP